MHAGTLATASKQAGAAHPFGGHRKHALAAAKRRVEQAAKRRTAMESSGQALGRDPASGADGQLVLRTDVGHLVAVARESPQHVLAKRQADLVKAKASRASNMHAVVQWSARSEIGDYLGLLRAADPASVKLLPWSPPDVEAFTFRMFSWCPPSSTLCLKIMQGMVAAGVQGKLKDAWLRQAEMIRHDEQPDLKNRLADGSSLSGFSKCHMAGYCVCGERGDIGRALVAELTHSCFGKSCPGRVAHDMQVAVLRIVGDDDGSFHP